MEYKVKRGEDPNKYGLPTLKKYPMPDAKHVKSAIKFFNYVTPRMEKELADAILMRMEEYGMSFDDINVGEDNRFSKYIPEDSLEHHGILGMKWGVRRFQNADGSLTPEGKARYLTPAQDLAVKNAFEKSDYKDDISDKVFSITKADKKALDEARQILQKRLEDQKEITKQKDEMFKDLETDNGYRNYLEAVSEIASRNYKNDITNLTLDDISFAAYMGIFEDGQQSDINAYSMYAYKQGISNKVDELVTKSWNVDKEASQAAADVVQLALSAVGGENLTAFASNSNYLASRGLVTRMMNSGKFSDWKLTNGSYYLNQANFASSFTDRDAKAIKDAEKIASNLKNNRDKNTWYLLNEAAENLGLSDVKAGDLTSSDWDKLNAEIARLR